VERRAHQRGLDDRTLAEGPIEPGRVEVDEPRPEREIRRRRLLRLEPAERLDGRGRVEVGPLEEQLPRQRRPVDRAIREDRMAGSRQPPSGPAQGAAPMIRPARNLEINDV
jgi:hypothetical protein